MKIKRRKGKVHGKDFSFPAAKKKKKSKTRYSCYLIACVSIESIMHLR